MKSVRRLSLLFEHIILYYSFITARRYASAAYAVIVCPSVCSLCPSSDIYQKPVSVLTVKLQDVQIETEPVELDE